MSAKVMALSSRLAFTAALALVLHGPSLAAPTMAQPASVQSPDPEPEGDLAAFRRLRAEGLAAIEADDLTLAADRLAEADRRIPNHPGLMILQARLAAATDRPEAALEHYGRYAGAGLVLSLERDTAFAALAADPAHADAATAITARIAANRTPVGADRVTPLFTLEGPVLAESLVRDETRGRWLVSLVAGRTVVAVDDAGRVRPWLDAHSELSGISGLALDSRRNLLWLTTAPLPPAVHGLDGGDGLASLLVAVDLETGRVVSTHGLPQDGRDHGLGDLTLGPDGTLYVSDGLSGQVWWLRAPEGELQPLVADVLGSPQGLVVIGGQLIVADYSSGLWRVPLDGGAATRLTAPSDAVLIGIDGLVVHDGHLYAIQNGVAPQRVLKLTLGTDLDAVTAVEVVAGNLPELDQPTTGLVRDGELVFVSRSQWSDFAPDGSLRSETPAPARIVRLKL